MVVIQGVKHGLALAAELHQLVVFQDAELVAHGALGHAQQLGDVVHAQLRGKEHIQDLDAGGIPEDLIQLRQIVQVVLIGHLLAHGGHGLLVQTQEILRGVLFHLLHDILLNCSCE